MSLAIVVVSNRPVCFRNLFEKIGRDTMHLHYKKETTTFQAICITRSLINE